MNYLSQFFSTDEVPSDDEIDELFSQLEVIAPPSSLIERIMETVTHLPHPMQQPPSDWDEEAAGLIVQHKSQPPS